MGKALRLVSVAIATVALLGCAGRPFGERVQPPEDVARFRRCWPTVQQTYCGGQLDGCQAIGEDVYVDPRTRGARVSLAEARLAWLRQWGCPASVLEER